MRSDEPTLSVLGELVVDLIPVPGADAGPEGTAPTYVARPGGNALNVAVAAGRLGTPVRLMARLGTGPLAVNLRRHADLSGVDPGGFVQADEPVSLAVVGLAPDGSADYGFHVLGAADWQWTDEELADVLASGTAILHVGSISSWTAPGCEAIARLVERLSGSVLISVDPNIRPMLAEGPVGATLGNTAEIVRGAAGPAAHPGRRREGQRRGPRVARARSGDRGRPRRHRPRLVGARARPGPRHRRRRATPDRPAGPFRPALAHTEGGRRRHRRRRRLARRGAAVRPARVRHHRPGRARGAARRGPAAPGGRRRARRRPQLHPRRRRPAHPRRSSTAARADR